ncbi:hypothetical protein [Streptomyces soliscabiei]|uniref:hypothetical protein n=1 Tax=Streptomyces soliscabiei TaxID=588897 RepID=UPI0029A5DAF7|nr:hypothetical protein [Streptomyces sp. NY05-11A]MDX2681105.1 hypothetical protein [Streptomyces sp. NY05-11A]
MAALTTTVVGLTGAAVAYTAAAGGGDTCQTGAGVLLLVKNGDASSHTVTLATPATVNGLAIADRAIAVAAGAEMAIPVTNDYRDPSTGRAAITYDAVTSVTVAVVRVPV